MALQRGELKGRMRNIERLQAKKRGKPKSKKCYRDEGPPEKARRTRSPSLALTNLDLLMMVRNLPTKVKRKQGLKVGDQD